MSIKQLPGTEPIYMVYDKRDRLVLSQDGNLRKDVNGTDLKKWMFTKYDQFNHPVLTGIYIPSSVVSQNDMQIFLDNIVYGSSPRSYYVTFDNLQTASLGYTDVSFPVSSDGSIEYLTASYYNNYTFSGHQDFDAVNNISDYTDNEGSNTHYFEKLNNMITGSKTKVLGSASTYLTSTNYYDSKYRLIQTVKNNIIGGTDCLSSKFDFAGKLKNSKLVHIGMVDKTINKEYRYDHAGRLIKIFHSIGTATPVLMSYMVYNELGQLVDKKLHVTDEGTYNAYVQSIDYRYNIRGWLQSINNPTLLNDSGVTNDDSNDKLGMKLNYQVNQ
jgi:hypothetical protein